MTLTPPSLGCNLTHPDLWYRKPQTQPQILHSNEMK